MRILCFGSLAALLAIGVVSFAEAAPSAGSFQALAEPTASDVLTPTPYDHCHGLSAGTADAKCRKTLSGGPVGGLF